METGKLISFARDIVRMPSLSGEERKVAQRVEHEMKSLGFDSVEPDEAGNVIGTVQGSQPGPTIVFDAHMDTVGISPGVSWDLDPYSGEVMEGSLYGRGSADMKGALAAMVYAAAALDRSRLRGEVVVSASVLEEVLEGVALETVINRTGADFVVIGESTDLNVARGGRGRAEVHLKTVGRPSHSSAPHQGRNAVLDMMQVISAVEAIELPEHDLVGPAIFALTDIISDPYPGHSVIPSVCRATYDRRLLPGESRENVLDAIVQAVHSSRTTHGKPAVQQDNLEDIQLDATIGIGEYSSYNGFTYTKEKFFPAWALPEEDDYVRKVLSALHTVGIDAGTRGYRFCTNAAYSAGVVDIPTVGFGPADEGDAHVVNEKLSLDHLVGVARGYRSISESVLGL